MAPLITPATLKRQISPPRTIKRHQRSASTDSCPSARDKKSRQGSSNSVSQPDSSLPAAIEAGHVKIQSHLDYFTSQFTTRQRSLVQPPSSSINPVTHDQARLSLSDFQSLYKRNEHSKGRHFVVLQHDHPIAGVHYDLRIQFSETSCLSFAIPYGLPGNPNSAKPHRLAIETRVHSLWNNLIESASHATGSLLIWDTGEYEVLNKEEWEIDGPMTEDEEEETIQTKQDVHHSQKLFKRFQKRSIKLRLHGTRLPPGYTIHLRLPSANNAVQGYKKEINPARKRRRKQSCPERSDVASTRSISPSEEPIKPSPEPGNANSPFSADEIANVASVADASDAEDEDRSIRTRNAYPDSTNTIGSIHQRAWIITLDRSACGFVKQRQTNGQTQWVQPQNQQGGACGFQTFSALGRDVERSIVTGRLAADLYADENVKNYVGRKGWRPITE